MSSPSVLRGLICCCRKSNSIKWPTHRVILHIGCKLMRECGVKFVLEVLKTCLPEAVISQWKEVSLGVVLSSVIFAKTALPTLLFSIATFGNDLDCSGLNYKRSCWHASTIICIFVALPLRLRHCTQEADAGVVTCMLSCPEEDAERFCEVLLCNGLEYTIEPL